MVTGHLPLLNSPKQYQRNIFVPFVIAFDTYVFVEQKWQEESNRMREKLLSLIGRIGRDGREPKTTTRVNNYMY